MTIEHKNIPDAQLHEVKGATGATSGQVLVATGSGTATFQTLNSYTGWYDYNDSTTAGSPIPLTAAATYYTLTNDGLGGNTNISYGVSGVTNLWDTTTNRFDFSNLSIGDTLDLRADVTVTTSTANAIVDLDIELAEGSGGNYDVEIQQSYFKTAGTYKIVGYMGLYIGNAITRDFPARIKSKCDVTGTTVVVNGWYVRVIKRSIG